MKTQNRFPVLTVCLSVILPTLAVAQERSSAHHIGSSVAAIDFYAGQIDRFLKRNPKRRRIFANVARYEDEPSRWQEFKTEVEREKAGTGENLNENAYVWLRAEKLVGVNLTLQSPSGDWAHFVMYYFREDGTLAKIQAQLNTFYDDLTVRRENFYSLNGKLLHTTTKYFDLYSQRPKKPDNDFSDFPIPVYRKVQDLPFYKLL